MAEAEAPAVAETMVTTAATVAATIAAGLFAATDEAGDAPATEDLPEKGVYPNFKTDSIFNREAPPSAVSFGIGGALMFVSAIMWYRRLQTLEKRRGAKLKGTRLVQGALACFFDNDDPAYTAASFAATSFLFLGGFQEEFAITWSVSLGCYFLSALADTSRTLFALHQYDSLADPRLRADIDRCGIVAGADEGGREKDGGRELERLEAAGETAKDAGWTNMEIKPGNIYADIGRRKMVVILVFAMQLFFLVVVCQWTYTQTNGGCFDGTSGCPIVHTSGSYLLYVVGIGLSVVYMLGPSTNFGRSEMDPEFWLILLLAAKGTGFKLLWDNPYDCPVHSDKVSCSGYEAYSTLEDEDGEVIKNENGSDKLFHCHYLSKWDARLWRRFVMSFLCNGVGFHILVHAVPIQLAMVSSWMGAIYRIVGTMYLVDLDDSCGFTLTIARHRADGTKEGGSTAQEEGASEEGSELDIDRLMQGKPQENNKEEMARQAQEIIDKAHGDLDRLQLCGAEKKEERPSLATHRSISSENVIMSVIGYGVMGLGGSGKQFV